MSQLDSVALIAQVITAWVALILLWQTWRDKRRDEASRVMVAIEKDRLGAQSLAILNEGDRTIQLNVLYQFPMGPKGIPDTKQSIITQFDKPLLAPHSRTSVQLDSQWNSWVATSQETQSKRTSPYLSLTHEAENGYGHLDKESQYWEHFG